MLGQYGREFAGKLNFEQLKDNTTAAQLNCLSKSYRQTQVTGGTMNSMSPAPAEQR